MEKCLRCRVPSENTRMVHPYKREGVGPLCPKCARIVERQALEVFAQGCISPLCDYLNGGSFKDLGEAVCYALQGEHRYLQNEFFLMLERFFREYQYSRYDTRNARAVQKAREWSKEDLT